jgi:hypothetical protein
MKYNKISTSRNTTINFVHADYCIQISHQRYISAVIHTALLNNVRKVGRLVLSRTSCFFSNIHLMLQATASFLVPFNNGQFVIVVRPITLTNLAPTIRTRHGNIELTAFSNSVDSPVNCRPELWFVISARLLSRRVGVYDCLATASVCIVFIVFLLSVNEIIWLAEYWICWILCWK